MMPETIQDIGLVYGRMVYFASLILLVNSNKLFQRLRKNSNREHPKLLNKRGEVAGEDKLRKLISMLLKENKLEEISLVFGNEAARKEYYQK